MYKLAPKNTSNKQDTVFNLITNTSIPFDPTNTDYAKFKLDLADGVELQDANGNVMSDSEVEAFIATLPA